MLGEPQEPTRDFMVKAQRRLGLNRKEFAKLCGVKPHAVSQWRSGAYRANGESVLRMVNALLERNLGQG